jgi:putative SOS response-associated peptidase YedK
MGAPAHKQPFAIRHPDQSPLPFAGLWERWHDLQPALAEIDRLSGIAACGL